MSRWPRHNSYNGRENQKVTDRRWGASLLCRLLTIFLPMPSLAAEAAVHFAILAARLEAAPFQNEVAGRVFRSR